MEHMGSKGPSRWISRFMHLIEPGADVLDLACGAGRHTKLFAAAGFQVTAVDVDVSQLGPIAQLERVETLQCDLESGAVWPFEDRRFGAVVVTNYLHRPILPLLAASLKPDGVLLYETFAAGNERFGKPSNPDFLLHPGELLDVFADRLTVTAYEHGIQMQPRSAVVQRICATNAVDPARLQPR